MANYVAVLLLGLLSKINGHFHSDFRICGTEQYMQDMFDKYPEWKAKLDQFDIDHPSTHSNAATASVAKTGMNRIVFPVRYHILFNRFTEEENVPDSTIAFQNARLQLDYSAMNPDRNTTPPVFISPVDLRSGDFGFTFLNAQTIRKATDVCVFSFFGDDIKFDSMGGSDVIKPETNLNFWSGALEGGLLGYAQFPGGDPITDGVAHLWDTLSPEVGGNSPFNLGRTATHEVGHWLNLRHIWGDSSDCSIDDFVDDTPAANAPNFGCPTPDTAPRSCPAENPFPIDMYSNYMDFVFDECMVMFTQGQFERALASVAEFRQGFDPSNITMTDIEYINWLYFDDFDQEITNNDDKCFFGFNLFYEGNLNDNSNSNKYIYGCTQSTKSTNVPHVVDIQFIYGNDSVCPNEYEKATQNLNAGNGLEIFMCHLRRETELPYNCAITDITFVRDGDTTGLDLNQYFIFSDNINPDGISLQLAIKTQEIIPGGEPCPTRQPTINPTKSPTSVCDKGCSQATLGNPCISTSLGDDTCFDYAITGSCPQGSIDCNVPGSDSNPCLLCQPYFPCSHNSDGSCTPLLPNGICPTGTTICDNIIPSPDASNLYMYICSEECSEITSDKPCISITRSDNTCFDYMSIGGCPSGTMDCNAVAETLLQK